MDRDYYEDIVDQVEDRPGGGLYRFVSSVFIYFITYNIMFISASLFMAFIAAWVGFDPIYKFMGVYNLPTQSKDWHRWLVLAVYGAIPVFGLVLGLTLRWVNSLLREYNTILKVFVLWMGVHGLTFFGSYLVSTVIGTGDDESPFYYGLAAAASWFHLEKPFMMPVTLGGMLFMIGSGIFFIRGFINLAYSRKVAINYNTRRKFLIQVLTGPWIVGTIMCLFTIWLLRPDNYDFNRVRVLMPHLVHHGSILLLIVGTIFRLDYIVGGIQVHSFDVFQGRMWIGVVGLAVVSGLIYILQHYAINF